MRFLVGDRVFNLKNIQKQDWLLIAGLCLAPMTGLRIWKIGPAEVLCLLWGIRFIFKSRFKSNLIFNFFILFYLSLCFGAMIGSIVAPAELSKSGLFTWAYLGVIAIALYEGLSKNRYEYNKKLLFLLVWCSTLWYSFLFLFGKFVRKNLFGAPLWYGPRFSAGATNPHQIAVMLCALCMIYLMWILKKKNIVINIAGFAVCVFLLIQTKSTTGILSVALSILIAAYIYVPKWFNEYRKRAMAILTVVAVTVLVLGYHFFYETLMEWVENDSNGMTRLEIFSTFSNAFFKSPLVGLGPGTHGRDGLIEFHNTYLEILAATGVLGGIVFVNFSVRLFIKTFKADWSLALILVSMYAYGLAGFAMRRLVFWGILAFVLVLAEQEHKSKDTG